MLADRSSVYDGKGVPIGVDVGVGVGVGVDAASTLKTLLVAEVRPLLLAVRV
jgi:hypothetical protein